MQKFVAIGLGFLLPKYETLTCSRGLQVFNVFGFLQLAAAYTRKQIFTTNTSKEVIPAKDMPFRGPNDDK